MKGGITQRDEGHEGRKDPKGGRTQREVGHKGREDTKGRGRTQNEGGGGEAPWTAPTKERKLPSK
jgi:hypothetical protein